MRLRNVPGSREAVAESEYVIKEEIMKTYRGRWQEAFATARPLYLEIGTGKGRFITDLAMADPASNYIGIEKYSSVLIKGLEKRDQLKDLHNLLFLRMDAQELTQVFGPGEVSGIYLNFSDPWPKDRHAKRRLPGVWFLNMYRQILVPGGRVEFKTDNTDLFRFAIESADEAGWRVIAVTWDLHNDPVLNKGNIMTEYEEKFSSKGNPICKLIIESPQK